MLRDVIMALKVLHGFGYAHGDLKPENICARETKEGKIKFTLIDFCLCHKLPPPDQPLKMNKYFRGNLMFASDHQLNKYHPNKFCDLISLVHVAYYFIYKSLPWTRYIEAIMSKDKSLNKYYPLEFTKIRKQNK